MGGHGGSDETALRLRDFETGEAEHHSFADLDAAANRVANYLVAHTERADRVAVMLSARLELYTMLFGALKAGRVYVPLAPLFGPDAIRYRLQDAGASVLVTDPDGFETVDSYPSTLDRVLVTDDPEGSRDVPVDPWDTVADNDDAFAAIDTHPNDPYALS